MNNMGKEKMALEIANFITTTFKKQIEEPVILYWKTEYENEVICA
jgi:hypothetical protein